LRPLGPELPGELAGPRVDRVELPVVAAHVDEVPGDGGRGEDVRLGVEVETEPSRLRVERQEARAVRGPDVDDPVADGRRADDPGLAGRIVPLLAAAGGVDRVNVRVAAADVDDAVGDRGRGLEADLVVDRGILSPFERPSLLAAVRVD